MQDASHFRAAAHDSQVETCFDSGSYPVEYFPVADAAEGYLVFLQLFEP